MYLRAPWKGGVSDVFGRILGKRLQTCPSLHAMVILYVKKRFDLRANLQDMIRRRFS